LLPNRDAKTANPLETNSPQDHGAIPGVAALVVLTAIEDLPHHQLRQSHLRRQLPRLLVKVLPTHHPHLITNSPTMSILIMKDLHTTVAAVDDAAVVSAAVEVLEGLGDPWVWAGHSTSPV